MGDIADFINDQMSEEEDYFWEPKNDGYYKESGPGPCPICGDSTVAKSGKFGNFYGCINFPKCKGSRKFNRP